MIRQVDPKKKSDRKKHFKWRGHEVLRIEGFSDAVFAFAMTLLVVSLEVPKTFAELKYGMSGLFGFGICFLMLMLIWYEQYVFFRQFHLEDLRTVILNGVLLFVVLVYVYPLKFLFALLTQGNNFVEHGEKLERISSNDELRQLMVIYGCGFVLVYFVFVLLYRHAYQQREKISLTKAEIFFTKTEIYKHAIMMGVGVFQILTSVYFPPQYIGISGISYSLIWPVMSIYYHFRFKKFKKLYTAEEIEAHYKWVEE